MRQRIDLGAETIAFVRQRVAEIVGENQEGYKLSPSLRKHRRKHRRKIICDARSHCENHTENHAENHTENAPEKYTKKCNVVARI